MAVIELKHVLETLVLDPPPLDMASFGCWLAGLTSEEAAEELLRARRLSADDERACRPFLEQDAADQYNSFLALEPYMRRPEYLSSQRVFQLRADTRDTLIGRYYEFDERVIREFLGKKLSTKSRKDWEPVAEITGVRVASCQRQFENLRRVVQTVSGSKQAAREVLRTVFLLPNALAERYLRVLFYMMNYIDTSKKRVQFLSFADLDYIAGLVLENWASDPSSTLMDPSFISKIRDLKSLLNDREVLDNYRDLCIGRLQSKISPSQVRAVQTRFRELMRSLLTIGASLSNTKEIRQLLSDIVDSLVEPCQAMNIDQHEVGQLFSALSQSFNGLDGVPVRYRRRFWEPWRRFLTVVSTVVIHCLSRATV